MNIQEFGQQIKQKYPQYQGKTDEEVGNAVLSKYPQYKDKINQPSPTFEDPMSGFGMGIGKSILSTANQGAKMFQNYIANPVVKAITGSPVQDTSVFQAVDKAATSTTGFQKAGKIVGDIGQFFIPGGAEIKGAKLLDAGIEGLKLPGMVEGGLKLGAKMGISGASTGTVAGIQKGEFQKGDFALGAAIPAIGTAASAAHKGITGSLAENVGKALGMTGKVSFAGTTEKIPQAVRALGTIAENAGNIIVKDLDGVEKAFNPSKATFGEALQALKSTKDTIYSQYTKLAKSAGDSGAKFAPEDFALVMSRLQTIASERTTPYATKAIQVLNDIKRLFPTGEADLSKIQTLIEDINKDVNPLSDKASAEVSGEVSRMLREAMDNKIMSSTGKGYQTLRSKYADLKSIENDLINKWKRSVRGTGSGIANWVEGFGTLDVAVSLITGNVAGAIKGAGMGVLAEAMKYLRNPETNLQRAFKMIQDSGKEGSDIKSFFMGGPGKTLTEGEQKSANTITQGIQKVGSGPAGMSIKDVSKDFSAPAVGETAKGSTSIGTIVGGAIAGAGTIGITRGIEASTKGPIVIENPNKPDFKKEVIKEDFLPKEERKKQEVVLESGTKVSVYPQYKYNKKDLTTSTEADITTYHHAGEKGASGKVLIEGKHIATGNREIPLGSKVYVKELKKTFTVEDRMYKGFDIPGYYRIDFVVKNNSEFDKQVRKLGKVTFEVVKQ